MSLYTVDALRKLSEQPQYTRNFCVVAHVDHGKTTLSDYLVASNGVLSPQLAGEVRLMDSRPDEQERRITMKASSIALCHRYANVSHVCNLVDSPGHIDFSCEVSTAMRLCDGALVLVDVVDGVTQQTCTILRQAYREGLSMCLVLNKIDLLITAQQLSAEEAYVRMRVVIETCNAMLAAYANQMRIQEIDDAMPRNEPNGDEDEDVWFDPCKGNVLFCSCHDSWAFDVPSFAKLYRDKLPGVDLNRCLWGEYYVDGRTKTATSTPRRPDQAPLAVQLMLEPLWKLYAVFLQTRAQDQFEQQQQQRSQYSNTNLQQPCSSAESAIHLAQCTAMANKLGIPEHVWNSPRRDGRAKLKALLAAWLPLARCVLDAVCSQLTDPITGQQRRLPALMTNWSTASPSSRAALQRCDTAAEAPCIAYVCKLIDTQYLVGGVVVRESAHTVERKKSTNSSITASTNAIDGRSSSSKNCLSGPWHAPTCAADTASACCNLQSIDACAEDESESDAFVGFARIYSGRLRVGQRVYVHSDLGVTQTTVRQVYMFRGIGLEETCEMCAGMLCGIGGLTHTVTKYATLTTELPSPTFRPLVLPSTSIVRLSVFPKQPAQLPQLEYGLKMLNKVDPQVEVSILPTGEHVIGTAGEVHAERCLRDLTDTFAQMEIVASEPLVTFRETIASRVNARPRSYRGCSVDGSFEITLHARTLPEEVWELICRDESNRQSSEPGSRSEAGGLARRVAAVLRADRRFAREMHNECDRAEWNAQHGRNARRDDLVNKDTVSVPQSDADARSNTGTIQQHDKQNACNGVIAYGPSRFGFLGAVLLMDADSTKTSLSKPTSGRRRRNSSSATKSGPVCAQSVREVDINGNTPVHLDAHMDCEEDSSSEDADDRDASNKDSMNSQHNNNNNSKKNEEEDKDDDHDNDDRNDCPMSSQAVLDTWRESIIAGFQAAVESGSMAQEPLFGIAFVITSVQVHERDEEHAGTARANKLSGGVVLTCVREACRAAVELHPRRLVEPVYECVVYSFGATQGKIYASLSRRRAEILEEVPNEGSDLFYVRCYLPAVEAFGLQDELRVHTQGASTAQLQMSHWQVIDADPYFVPTTRAEIEEHGAEVASKNIAAVLLERVRRRKGLYRERAVENAEKQKFSLKGA